MDLILFIIIKFGIIFAVSFVQKIFFQNNTSGQRILLKKTTFINVLLI